jgi:FkbM family methyltransferase
MGVKSELRRGLRRLGLEVSRYRGDPYGAFRQRFLDHYQVDLVIDVGANSGQYGEGVRACGYRGRILSFEPVTAARTRLEACAGDDDLWAVSAKALGSVTGAAKINVAGNGAMSSSLLPMLAAHSSASPGADYVGTEDVEVCRLDELTDMIGAARRIHLKLDVQGLEGEVLDGARALGSRIAGIEMELSFVPLYEGGLLYREAFERMADTGYTLKQLFPGLTDYRTGALLQADAIFYRDEA